MRTRLFAIAAGLLAVGAGACNFDITNTNQPTLDDLLSNPTRTKLAAAATGVIAGARGGIQALIWRLGSTGREGINLSGNNQPDFVEPYFGPVAAGGSFGGTLWFDRYQHIRSINVYLAALGNAKDAAVDPVQGLSTQEKAGARAVANSLKALALLYVVETRGELGAPVDVDRPLNAAPAPFVSEDSAYGYIVGLLNGAATDLTTAGATAFPFPVPPGLGGFDKPATFLTFNRALAAKANVLRATAKNGCGGTKATCYAAALTALGASFINPGATTPTGFQAGAYFDFSTAQGDATNSLSSPLNEFTFYALQGNETDAQLQTGGAKDQLDGDIKTLTLGENAGDTYKSVDPRTSNVKVRVLTDARGNAIRASGALTFTALATHDDGTYSEITVTGTVVFVQDGGAWKIEAYNLSRSEKPAKAPAASGSTSPTAEAT